MRKSGQITVFLTLAMMCICSLVCGLIESARTAGAGWYLKQAADSAMDSIFSGYHREVWEKYRLFLLEYGEKKELEEAWLHYMEPYMEEHAWYPVTLQSASVIGMSGITDDHGTHFKQEIQDYMRYGILAEKIDEKTISKLWDRLKEAGSLQKVSGAYNGRAKEAVGMERALETLYVSFKRQEESEHRAKERLSRMDGRGFREEAGRLKKEIRRVPGLIKAYSEKAEIFAAHLTESRNMLMEEQDTWSDGVRQAMAGELADYESYSLESGEKRREIQSYLPMEEENMIAIDRSVKRSAEVEEELAHWDEEEEGEGPDKEALWNSVEAIWHDVKIPGLTFRTGIKDPEKQNMLEQVQKMAGLHLLKLILPEGTKLSEGVIPVKNLPSTAHSEGGETKDGLVERFLTDEYCTGFFTCFLSGEEKEVKYEREYLLGGKAADEENLKAAAARILALREGLNLIHILSDGEKREEARTLAGVITGIVGAAPFIGIVAFFIMTVWALGESIIDLKALLAGKQVPLIKSRDTWRLDLAGLLSLGGRGRLKEGEAGGQGMDYGEYLKLLLFIETAGRLYYRMMDVIQMNILRSQADFSMEYCAYQAEIEGKGIGKHLFLCGGDPHYEMTVHTDKAY